MQAVILAIDPGKRSGFSIWIRGILATWGPIEPGDELTAVQAARVFEANEKLPLIVVGEKWTAGGWRSAASMMGMGAQWGRWDGALRAANHPKRRVVRVYPQTWRAAILRPRRGANTEQLKHLSVTAANYVAASSVPILDDNVADAINIGRWATRAAVVEALMPKGRAA